MTSKKSNAEIRASARIAATPTRPARPLDGSKRSGASKRMPLLLAHLDGKSVARAVIGKAEARGWKGLFDTATTPATRSAVLRGTPESFRQALEAAAGRPVDELGGEERLQITVRL